MLSFLLLVALAAPIAHSIRAPAYHLPAGTGADLLFEPRAAPAPSFDFRYGEDRLLPRDLQKLLKHLKQYERQYSTREKEPNLLRVQRGSSDNTDRLNRRASPSRRPAAAGKKSPLRVRVSPQKSQKPNHPKLPKGGRLALGTSPRPRTGALSASPGPGSGSGSPSTDTPIDVTVGKFEVSTGKPVRIPGLTGCTAIFIHGKNAQDKPILVGIHVNFERVLFDHNVRVMVATALRDERLKGATIKRFEVHSAIPIHQKMAEEAISYIISSPLVPHHDAEITGGRYFMKKTAYTAEAGSNGLAKQSQEVIED